MTKNKKTEKRGMMSIMMQIKKTFFVVFDQQMAVIIFCIT